MSVEKKSPEICLFIQIRRKPEVKDRNRTNKQATKQNKIKGGRGTNNLSPIC